MHLSLLRHSHSRSSPCLAALSHYRRRVGRTWATRIYSSSDKSVAPITTPADNPPSALETPVLRAPDVVDGLLPHWQRQYHSACLQRPSPSYMA
jgi:ribosomal protein S10